VKIMGPYPTNLVGLLLGLSVALGSAGCGDNNPPPGSEVAREIKGTELPGGLGRVTTGYCRHDYDEGFNCVLRTEQGRATCTTSVDADGHPVGMYCRRLGG
jgi:hypothetical protein